MKYIFFVLFLLLNLGFANAQGVEKIIVEKYYISGERDAAVSGNMLPLGSVTYRIYVDMLPGYRFQAAFGIPDHELRLATSTMFFNHQEYGGTVSNVIPDRNLKDNIVMLDSWISAGGASEANLGILKTLDNGIATINHDDGFLQNENPSAGIPVKIQDGLIAGISSKVTAFGIDSIVDVFGKQTTGSVFSTTNGSWAAMKGAIGPDSLDNKILIAQMTTDGVFSFELNVQVGGPKGEVLQYVAKNPTGKQVQCEGLIYSSGIKNNSVAPKPKPAGKK